MRGTVAAALAASFVSFLSTTALAAPLTPGLPAGVRTAQLEEPRPLIVLGLAAVAIGITLAVTADDNGSRGAPGSGPGAGGNGGGGSSSSSTR